MELVVFIDHVKRSERGLISCGLSLPPIARLSFVVGPVALVVILVLFKSPGRRYDPDALAVLPVILFPRELLGVAVDVVDSRIDFLETHQCIEKYETQRKCSTSKIIWIDKEADS
jgi:hypothetical protein